MGAIVHLVRHCAHGDLGVRLSGRAPGVSLTGEGARQAEQLGQAIAAEAPVAVQSSPRERALETAAAIADPLGLAVERIEALDEIDFGAWQGKRFDELAGDPAWQDWNARRSAAPTPGGETMAAAVARVATHLETLAEANPPRPVVCVTHCDIIRGAVAHYLGLGLDHILRFDVDPGSRTTLALDGGGGRLLTLNRGYR